MDHDRPLPGTRKLATACLDSRFQQALGTTIAADSAVRCTRRLLEAYCETGRDMPDVAMLTQVIGAKLLVRTAMNNYLAAGRSPFATLIQQSAEHCLNHPKALTKLLSIPTSTREANATL